MLSKTSVAANTIGHNTVYDDDFVVKPTVSICYDSSVVVEQTVIQGYVSDIERVCAGEVSNTSDKTVECPISPSEHAVTVIELRFGEFSVNEVTDFSYETGDKNDLSPA